MLNRSLSYGKSEERLFTAKQNKFAKVNSTHRKGHRKKKRKVTLIIKKKHNVAAKESIKKISSHESEIE